MGLTREQVERRRAAAADRVVHLQQSPKLGAIAIAQEDLALCDAAIAHLAARERSVQGWVVINANGDLLCVELNPRNAAGLWEGQTCQPVTITINAAEDDKRCWFSPDVSDVCALGTLGCSKDHTHELPSEPPPATPVSKEDVDAVHQGLRDGRIEYLDSAPVAESAEAAVDELMHGVYAYARIAHEFYKVADGDNSDERTRLRDAANVEATKLRIRLSAAFNERKADGIRKGLEMANDRATQVIEDGAASVWSVQLAIHALLDAQKEGV